MFSRKLKITTTTIALGLALTACSGGSKDANTIKIGTTEASADYWKPFEAAAKEKGITIEPVSFSDYTQVDPALAQNQTDLNLFQHLAFLADYNVKNNQNLTPIGSTYVTPLSLYSKKHTQVSQIPQDGTIAIPNDPTNQARALLLLQKAGLLKLNGGGNILSTPADISSEGKKVKVQAIDAAQTPANLPAVDAAVINNDKAQDAKIDPNSAIFKDDPNSDQAQPYINVIVSRANDKDNENYKKVVEAYKEPEVQQAVKAQSKNTSVLVNKTPAELEQVLNQQQEIIKQASQK
ncbi:MAG: MetQ/NlpA family ABC transporter substrate-binding protein [Micrococcaceae bacterium]